ncbi:16S rRNA (adenine(1518)-N(6)/adenine(1519)-N(6))-dimethyltransferase RsmA [Candidatus Clavichlamydia salmonicola]|uniref:16S rRNA (adenine(1518)-N(6)/adenine(1519)-N(6))- dimethyltransferase RsmA n=1 Tax=Candidatus Clavichlamydia salmonicola TaxID=469812 RepID=UPI001891801E|nr:16S rRNA (adenine(1518)-N(6)/adenine(1519)-N(6))-dimethyltransferase RsmA [Candidatus Clavichlamydia salmonicola]
MVSSGRTARRSLSQNFLIDSNIVKKIVKEAAVNSKDTILEIGPGPGALTEGLLLTGASVQAVEKDEAFRDVLETLPGLNLVFEDICDFSNDNITPGSKLVANLPYHLSSVILTRFVACPDLFTDIVIMVQEEMARRMIAKPGTADYSSLTILLNFYSNVTYSFKVSRNCFYPRPKVDSAIVHLELKKDLPNVNQEDFFNMVRTAFQKRRKQLPNCLETLFPKEWVISVLNEMGLKITIRPEELSLELWLSLYGKLYS